MRLMEVIVAVVIREVHCAHLFSSTHRDTHGQVRCCFLSFIVLFVYQMGALLLKLIILQVLV